MCMQLHRNLNYSSDQLLSDKNYFVLIVVLNNLNSWMRPWLGVPEIYSCEFSTVMLADSG